MLDTVFPKIHKEGYKFIIIFVFITLILYFINGFLGFVGFLGFAQVFKALRKDQPGSGNQQGSAGAGATEALRS